MKELEYIEELSNYQGEEAMAKVIGKEFDYDKVRNLCQKMNNEFPDRFDINIDCSDENLMKEVANFFKTLVVLGGNE